MAGDWIKMRADLHTHPKVVRIASALKADRLRVIGGLHAVWCLFDVHSIDGSLSGYSPEALDDLIGFAGFANALAGVEWLIIESDSISLPRFDEHNGQSAKRRATETERKRVARKMSAVDADNSQTKCGPEKRREEKSIISPPTPSGESERGRRTPKWIPIPNEFSIELKLAFQEWQKHIEEMLFTDPSVKVPTTSNQQSWFMEVRVRGLSVDAAMARAIKAIRYSISINAKTILWTGGIRGDYGEPQGQENGQEPPAKPQKRPLLENFRQYVAERNIPKLTADSMRWKYHEDLPTGIRDDFEQWRMEQRQKGEITRTFEEIEA